MTTKNIIQGNSHSIILNVLDEFGEPFDMDVITTIRYVLTTRVNDTTTLVEKDYPGSDIVISEPKTLGVIRINLSAADTSNLPPMRKAYHEARMIDNTGNAFTILSENVAILDRYIIN